MFDWLFFIKLVWWIEHILFFKQKKNKNAPNFGGVIINFIWFNKFDQINMTGY